MCVVTEIQRQIIKHVNETKETQDQREIKESILVAESESTHKIQFALVIQVFRYDSFKHSAFQKFNSLEVGFIKNFEFKRMKKFLPTFSV